MKKSKKYRPEDLFNIGKFIAKSSNGQNIMRIFYIFFNPGA